jgi:Zn-dependent M28 family amino/carboxypeptidase
MGLKVRYQHWEEEPTIKNIRDPTWFFGWSVGDNIEATLPGTNESSDEIYVLVAHYDTANILAAMDLSNKIVGANDDSSGVALLLAAAKLMSQYSFDHTVRFVAVSGEEPGLAGSKAYAEEAVKNKDNIAAVFNVDMIGNRGPGYRNTEVIVAGDNESSWIVNFTMNVNKRYPEFLNFTIIMENSKKHGSDHKSFSSHGYDAVCVAEAVEDYDWHRKSDIIKNMDISYTTAASRLVLATVAELAWGVNYG